MKKEKEYQNCVDSWKPTWSRTFPLTFLLFSPKFPPPSLFFSPLVTEEVHSPAMGCAGFAKVMLYIINAIFIALGLAVLGLGAYAVADGAQYGITTTVAIGKTTPLLCYSEGTLLLG